MHEFYLDDKPLPLLRVVKRYGTLWYFCKDVCALLGVSENAVKRLDRHYAIYCQDHEGRRRLAINLHGVCALVALDGLSFTKSDVQVSMDKSGTDPLTNKVFPGDIAAAHGLGNILMGLATHAHRKPRPDRRPGREPAGPTVLPDDIPVSI